MSAARERHSGRSPASTLASTIAQLAHVLVLVAVVFVPIYAGVDALGERFRSALPLELSLDLRRWIYLLGNTLLVGSIATTIAMAAALPVALLLARSDTPGRHALAALLLLAACMPLYVGAIFTLALVPAVHLSGSTTVCGAVSGALLFPLTTVLLRLGLRGGSPAVEEQALLEAPPWKVAIRVILPQARGAIAATALLVFVLVTGDALVSDLLAVRTFAEEVYAEFILDPTRIGPVLSAVPMTISFGLALLAASRCELVPPPTDTSARSISLPLGRLRGAATLALWLSVLAGATIPLYAACSRIGSFAALATALAAALPSVATSLGLGVCAATLVLLVSPGLASLALSSKSWMLAIGTPLVLLVATPAPVVGVALVRLFNRPGLLGEIYDNPGIIAIGHVVRLLPFGVALLAPAVQRVPRALVDTARIDGCDWLGIQTRLIWPLTRGTRALAWLIVVLLSFAEVNVSKLVAPPGWETAAGLAFTLLHFGVYGDLAALALLSTIVVAGLWVGLIFVARLQTSTGARQ